MPSLIQSEQFLVLMRFPTRIRSAVATAARSPLVIVVVALLASALVAPAAFGAAEEYRSSADAVAVIEVPPLIAGDTATPVKEQLAEARQNDSIQAVVLAVDTPGGGLAATEALALEVERTAETMPVVASVDTMATSGGYYVSAPADHIVAKPSAMVGSVGINFQHAGAVSSPDVIQSGPDKAGGFTEVEAIEYADIMVEGFYGTVLDHRGDELALTKDELAYAKIYPSQVAVEHGLIDEIGTTDTAVQRAAELAGLDRYEVVQLETGLEMQFGPGLFEPAEDDPVPLEDEAAAALLDPHPGIDTPVPMALFGTVAEEPALTTAGEDAVTVHDPDAFAENETEVADDA